EAELTEIDDWAAIYAIRLLEQVGLDVVYDGEQRRTEMYDHVAAFARGFEPRGTVRSFDNKYYAKAAVVEPPSVEGPQDVEEDEFVRARTGGRTGPTRSTTPTRARSEGRGSGATRPGGASSPTWRRT